MAATRISDLDVGASVRRKWMSALYSGRTRVPAYTAGTSPARLPCPGPVHALPPTDSGTPSAAIVCTIVRGGPRPLADVTDIHAEGGGRASEFGHATWAVAAGRTHHVVVTGVIVVGPAVH